MKSITESPFRLWLVLTGLTILSWMVLEGGAARLMSGTAILVIAAAKSRLIILHYMEAKNAAKQWRFLFETWNFSCAALLIYGNAVTLLAGSSV